MGDAKRRKKEVENRKRAHAEWCETLNPVEQEVARVAERAYERIVAANCAVSACYLLAFFLRQYLKREKDIDVDSVVGWVNDCESALMVSHAWIELGGKKTDISLTRTEHPTAQPTGALIILDRIVRPGTATYTYHREQSSESIIALNGLRNSAPPEIARILEQKAFEHLRMVATAKSDELIRAYLDAAPRDRNYNALAGMLK